MGILPTSVQHGGFRDVDGAVSQLGNESRQGLWGFGVELDLPVNDSC